MSERAAPLASPEPHATLHSPSDTVEALLLAGGRGTRLGSYAAVLPKPLVPLGDMPVLEILLRRLRMHNLTNLVVCTGHLAELIQAYFGSGERFGVRLRYAREDTPLGTAGPIRSVDGLGDSFLVLNGDLLTTLDFSELLARHHAGDADATIAVYPREVRIDSGVLDVGADGLLQRYREKPRYHFDVSMGVYVFDRWVRDLIPAGRRLDIPELIGLIQARDGRVACYRSDCYWLDIGRPDDYARAQAEFEQNRARFLPESSASLAQAKP